MRSRTLQGANQLADKSKATFVSSLDIAVQGAIPIDNESDKVLLPVK